MVGPTCNDERNEPILPAVALPVHEHPPDHYLIITVRPVRLVQK